MLHISQEEPHMVKVESVIEWRKCDLCGLCHPDNLLNCPRIKSFDKRFGYAGNPEPEDHE
ncbi:MAG: hypothetical protein GX549_04340 [Clostridiales bacterium]|nr:hypothetical protein [Clostridiales bacterium]